MPHTIHGDLHISLFHVERSSYHALHLVNHSHPYWAISYVAVGEVKTECRGHSFAVDAGDVMIHPPHIAYSELANVPGRHEWLLIEAASISPQVDLFRQYPVSPVIHIASPAEFSTLFNELLYLWQEKATELQWLHMLGLTIKLLSVIIVSWEQAGRPARPIAMRSPEDRFVPVISYMADHLGEHISRQLLAERMGLHPVYFDRLFRQTYDMPPMRMLREMRLKRARDLLEVTDNTLESIAYSCGLGSGSSFVRVFQRQFGQTPGDYRQSLKRARNSYAQFL